jgi:hypothetical protein
MDGVPPQLLFAPLLVLGVIGYLVYSRTIGVKKLEGQYAQYRAGELAQRLGLQLVKGDPQFNLFVTQAQADVARGPSDGRPIHIEVRAEGAPQGVPLTLSYLMRVTQEENFSHVTWRTWFDCRLSVAVKTQFPPFEVFSRNAPQGPIAQTLAFPPQATGNPQVDALYTVLTPDARLAQLLGNQLGAFAGFANSGIHLVGEGSAISFLMQQSKAPVLAVALGQPEAMASALTALARAIGG